MVNISDRASKNLLFYNTLQFCSPLLFYNIISQLLVNMFNNVFNVSIERGMNYFAKHCMFLFKSLSWNGYGEEIMVTFSNIFHDPVG